MEEKKRANICRKLLMFFFCCMMFLSRPLIESQASDVVYTYTDATTRVQYSFYIASNGGDRAVITSVYVPSTVTSLVVPGTVSYRNVEYPVVAIGTIAANTYVGAFINSGGKPVSITLPDSVCEIYQRAFEGLPNLQSISLNGDGIVIGYEAFKGCKNLSVEFRGEGAVKYISGYAFETSNSNCLDYNVIKNRVNKDSWIGYDATWNNEAEWKALVNSLSPFSVSIADDSNRNWEPTFEKLDENNGYPNQAQIANASIYTSDYNAWIRKAAKWVDIDEEKAEIRLDVAYNPMSGKSTNDMVFILDVSGSMFYGYNLIAGSNYSRQFQTFDQVRSVGKALLDLNESSKIYNRVGACTFGAGTAARGTSRNASDTSTGFFTDYASFVKWLDRENYLLAANTGYSLGLDEAANLFKNRSDKDRTPSVVFLSDGAPNLGTKGVFPGTTVSGYGGQSTKDLSDLGVTRYSILLGENSSDTLQAVTLIAGEPNKSNDSTRTYASPDAATLQRAFQEILVQMTENMSLSLSDKAGAVFDVNGTPVANGGGVSISGVSTSWDLSGTEPRQIYTLIITQDLKRNSDDHDAFFYGELETNLGNAVLKEADMGEILSVASPVLSKILGTVTINVYVTNGVATDLQGNEKKDVSDTIRKTGTYTANYKGNYDAFLVSIDVAEKGGTPVPINIEAYPSSYTMRDIRCDYDIWVVYRYPETGNWSFYATAENGTINPKEEKDIPLGATRPVLYSPEEGYELDYILIGRQEAGQPVPPMRKLSENEKQQNLHRYNFTEDNPGIVHIIHVQYKKIAETAETEDLGIWGDYRR